MSAGLGGAAIDRRHRGNLLAGVARTLSARRRSMTAATPGLVQVQRNHLRVGVRRAQARPLRPGSWM